MKKIFKSAFSLLTSLAVISGISISPALADEIQTEYGVIDLTGEEIMLGELDSFSFSELPETPQILANYSEKSYNYGDFLDENNKAVYDAFVKLTDPSVDEIRITLPEPIQIVSDSIILDTSTEEFYYTIFANCKPGMDSAVFDVPELFWLDESKIGVGTGKTPYSYSQRTRKYTFSIQELVFEPGYYDVYSSLDEVLEYKEKLEQAVADFEVDGETRYEQIKSIHDQISLFTNYDTNADFSPSAIGAVVQPGAVCEGYSKGFKIICDKLDIPCVCVFGNYDREKNVAHMWNYVLMEDNNWYAVDVTWDDYDGDYGIDIVYTYFLKGSDSFNKNHTPESDFNITYFTYPEIPTYNYDPSRTAEPDETTLTTTMTTAAATTTTTAAVSETTTVTETTTSKKTSPGTTTAAETVTTTTTESSATTTTTMTSAAEPSATTTTETTTTTATEPVTTATATEFKSAYNGDVNNDGKISVADLVYCSVTIMGMIEPEYSCDVNNDGKTDVFDVVFLRQLVIGIIR